MTRKRIKVTTQAEFDACVNAGNIALCTSGYFTASGSASVTASGGASVRAYDSASVTASDSASVTASDSASVRAYDSASVTASDSASVTAYDSASVTASDSASVRAYDSASVTAYDSASVRASDSASVRAFARVFVRLFSCIKIVATAQVVILREPNSRGDVEGGHIVQASAPKDAAGWCEEYSVEVKDGVAVLYKGLGEDFHSGHGTDYTPGTIPVASDWDGGLHECGGGLHFSPCPDMTLQFASDAKKFVACPVALADMRAPQASDNYPGKIKARGCCAPTYEVDRAGNPIMTTKAA